MTKQVRQAITPTHVLGSTGTDTADDLGYRALADLKSDMGLNLADLADTWNDAGTTFTGIKLNVTDTASDADSLLMDLQVDGASRFSVSRPSGAFVQGQITIGSVFLRDYQGLNIGEGTNYYYSMETEPGVDRGVYKTSSSGGFGWVGAGATTNGADTYLKRDAAGVIAQRNSTNPQTFNLYNTYTDGSNYERGFMKWNSNVLEIGTEALGTGTARDVVLNGNNRVSKISDVSTGTDTAYETAINAIIDALEAHGLAATV